MTKQQIDLYSKSPKISKNRIDREIKKINSNYNPIIFEVKRKISNSINDFTQELNALYKGQGKWFLKSYSYRTKKGVDYDDNVGEFMIFNHVFAGEVPFTMHILNHSFEKINFEYGYYGVGEPTDPKVLKNLLKKSLLEKKCKEFLIYLPDEINVENTQIFFDLIEEYGIPDFSNNSQHDVMERLRSIK